MEHSQPVDIMPSVEAIYKGVVADPATFAPKARQLVERARSNGCVEELVVALRAHAWAERLTLRNLSAKALLDEAARLAERHGLDRRLGEVLVSRVAVQHELGRLRAAQRDADRAVTLLPPTERADLRFQQGVLLQNAGRLNEASRHYRQVLEDPACPPTVAVKAGNNLAHLECQMGRTEVALALLDVADEVAVVIGPRLVAHLAHARAWVEMQGGRLVESLALFDAAHRLYEVAGLPLGEYYLEYSDALAGLRLLPEALAAARQGTAELPEGEVSLMAAEAQLRVARLSLLMGDGLAASAAAEHGAALLRRQRRPGWLARAAVVAYEASALSGELTAAELRGLRRRALDLERSGMRSDAVEAHLLAGRLGGGDGGSAASAANLRAAERLSRGAPVLIRLRGRIATALLWQAAHDPRSVIVACRLGLADLERHRRALPTMELRVLASGHGEELGNLGLRALLSRPDDAAGASARPAPTRIFAWLERTRSAALTPLETPSADGVEREMGALRAVHAELDALRQQGIAESASLMGQLATAEAAVRRASWSSTGGVPAGTPDGGPGRASSPNEVSAAGVRAHLGSACLVEFGMLDGRLLATVLDRRHTRLAQLGSLDGLSGVINNLLFALRRLTRPCASTAALEGARRTADVSLQSLRERLLRPLNLNPASPLIVVPVGDLQRIPWAPLHPAPTTVVPSARIWLRTLQSRAAGSGVALIAGPDLPGAAREVSSLSELHRNATVLVPPYSTCRATVGALRGVGLAHLACHGRLRADNPAFAALLLADGPLTVHELSLRGGAPDRVVLAACESGSQVGFPGGEALGFVSALLARGSAGVIASGMLVPDEQVRPLMCALHGRLAAGATVAEGLWTARQALDLEDPVQLAIWCAFDAYGAA
jgi:tetratricopeptide (TPR) repeat protein